MGTPRSMGYGSPKYGPCEVCGEYCPDTWINRLDDGTACGFLVMGHRDCVTRSDVPAVVAAVREFDKRYHGRT